MQTQQNAIKIRLGVDKVKAQGPRHELNSSGFDVRGLKSRWWMAIGGGGLQDFSVILVPFRLIGFLNLLGLGRGRA